MYTGCQQSQSGLNKKTHTEVSNKMDVDIHISSYNIYYIQSKKQNCNECHNHQVNLGNMVEYLTLRSISSLQQESCSQIPPNMQKIGA